MGATGHHLSGPLGQNTAAEEANAATLVASHRYLDPFGNPRGSSATWSSSHGFLNQPSNPDTATTHLGARDYDPVLGRFLSADPLLDPGDPQQAEGYSYAGNDPVNRSDPSGAMANKFLGDTPSCEPLCHGESSGTLPGANGSTITITNTGQVTVTYSNDVSGGDRGGQDNVNGITIPVTRHTHVQVAAFTAGFSAHLPHYLREWGHDPSGSVYQFDRTELRNALMEYCTTVPDCQQNDIYSGGANGFKGIMEAATVGAPFAAGGVAGIIGNKQPVGGGIRANQAAGNAARDAIAAERPGSLPEQSFDTTLGARRVDVLTEEGVAIESKVGRVSLTSGVRTQIAKDEWLQENDSRVTGVEWVFSRSGVTGKIGPTGPLQAALDKAGIAWMLRP